MIENELRGVFPYLVSPVTDSGEVKADVLAKLVNHLVHSGVHGLTPLGSTGEFAYLSWPQRRRVVEVVRPYSRRGNLKPWALMAYWRLWKLIFPLVKRVW